MSPPQALVLQDLSLRYRGGDEVIAGITGAFEAGSLTAIIGPNGCGKTTLLRALAGQVQPSAGTLTRLYPVRRTAYLPQLAEAERAFPMTVFDFVALGAWQRTGWWRSLSGAPAREAHEALDAVGLGGKAACWIGELSGGQFQRMRFARLLLQDAPVVLLDEPLAAVDAQTSEDILCLVSQWHAAGKTVVAVLHDLQQVLRCFPQTLSLEHAAHGRIRWGATRELLQATVAAPHGSGLVRSIDSARRRSA